VETEISRTVTAAVERLGWAQADLARVLGWPVQTVSEVVQGKRRIDAPMALDLAEVTGTSAEAWLQLQAAHELAEALRAPGASSRTAVIARRRDLESVVPTRELTRRGVISQGSVEDQIQQVCELLEVDDLDSPPPFVHSVATKRSQSPTSLTRNQVAWIALGRREAAALTVSEYSPESFQDFAQGLPQELLAPTDFVGLPARFAEVGVRLVHVPALAGGRIDGVCMEYRESPLIIVSGRGRRIDRVAFTLLHECAHVALGHWREGTVGVHDDGSDAVDIAAELKANDLAASWVMPRGIGAGAGSGFSRARIDEIARANGVSRAMVIGHLQHTGVIPWASVHTRALPTVTEALQTW